MTDVRQCSIPKCRRPLLSRGMCSGHYDRWRCGRPIAETPLHLTMWHASLAERLWARIEKRDSGCWEWTGQISVYGYGQFKWEGRKRGAHIWVYELITETVPDGLQLDHLCRNRACVNPSHLEAVTPRENQLRGSGFPATNAAKTHCSNGHEFTEENTYTGYKGRSCRACHRDIERVRRAAARSSHV